MCLPQKFWQPDRVGVVPIFGRSGTGMMQAAGDSVGSLIWARHDLLSMNLCVRVV